MRIATSNIVNITKFEGFSLKSILSMIAKFQMLFPLIRRFVGSVVFILIFASCRSCQSVWDVI